MNLRNLNLKYALVNIGFMLLVSGSVGFPTTFSLKAGSTMLQRA